MEKNDFYTQRERGRLLRTAQEYSTGKLAWQVSFGLAFVFGVASYDFSTNTISSMWLILTGLFAFMGLLQLFICKKIETEIFAYGEVQKSTRRLGYLLIPFIFTGNFFICIAGFMLVRKNKPMEYSLCVYAILANIFVIVITMLIIFKPYVTDTFLLGVTLIVVSILLNIVVMVQMIKRIDGPTTIRVDNKLMVSAILAILSGLVGNVFSILLGFILIAKVRRKDEEISIEWVEVVRRLFKNYMSVIGLFFVVFLIVLAITCNLTFDYDMATVNDYSALLETPSLQYPFGTDDYGRCVFTRIVFGVGISLSVGLSCTALPMIVGGALGAYAGYYGGRKDNIMMRCLDILYAVPGILLAIAIIAAFGVSITNLVLALSIGGIPSYARTVRASVLTVSSQEYVEAAKACGAKNSSIIFKHVIPNALAPVIVTASLSVGSAVLATSSLSFLGLGVESHVPEWGNILKTGSSYLETAPYIAIIPGIAIILLVLSFNYFGDGLRDALDPKLK